MPDPAPGALNGVLHPREASAADLALMRRIDELHLEHPFAGSRMLRDLLRELAIDRPKQVWAADILPQPLQHPGIALKAHELWKL
jgi:hypothetical protein